MKRNGMAKLVSLVLAVLLLVGIFPLTASADASKHSGVEYVVTMDKAYDVFIGNKTPVDAKNGAEVYLTYTVMSIDTENTTSTQHGVVATDAVTERYPYDNGGVMFLNYTPSLMEVGYTYFFKFYVEDGAFMFDVVRAKDGEKESLYFTSVAGEQTDVYNAFGMWMGVGYTTAHLEHVMCYDQDGNDLGVQTHGASATKAEVMQYDDEVGHSYNVSIVKESCVALLSAKPTAASTVYFEYTVKSTDSRIYQTGLLTTRTPLTTYPFNDGYMMYESFLDNPNNGYLLMPGASYIVRMTRNDTGMEVVAQRTTADGKTESRSFPNMVGDYDRHDPYIGLWYGEGAGYPVTFELINVKCYDENKNNLGIQCNRALKDLVHIGYKDDYSSCEALYYSEKSSSFVALYADQTAKVTRDGETVECTYLIDSDTLFLVYEDGKEGFDYFYERFENADEVYDRMGTYYVEFVDGTDNPPARQTVNEKTGFTAMKPADPTREGAEFLGWVLSDGSDFDFDTVVTESLTLYAKWSDGIAYKAVDGEPTAVDPAMILAIAASALLLVGGAVTTVLLLRKGGKKNASK